MTGMIDWQEFLAATVHVNKLENDDIIMRAFKKFDRDGDGAIRPDEVAEVLKVLHIGSCLLCPCACSVL